VRRQQKHEERGDGADGKASSSCMSLLQTKLSPFTVYVSSVFVVVAAAAQAVAALHPRSCVACLAVVSSSQFLALAWTALLRPALLAPVNVLVALSHLCVFIASVAATAVIGMSSGGASSPETVAVAEGAVSVSKALLYTAVVVTNVNVLLNGVVRLLTIVLGVWTVATETEAATTLAAAERKRRRQLRRAAGGEHGNVGNKFGGAGGDGDEALLTSSLKRRRESIASMVAQARQSDSPRGLDERGHSQRRASPLALAPTGSRRRASDTDHDAVEMRASPRRFTPTPRSSPILRPQPHLRGGRATDSDLDDDFLLRRGSGPHRHSDNRRVSPRRNPPPPPSPHQPLPPSARHRAQPNSPRTKPAEEGRNKFAFALPKFSFDLL
jgi:hypothetical protein